MPSLILAIAITSCVAARRMRVEIRAVPATQEVMAIARMSDGTFFADRRHVEVVVGGFAG